MPLTCYWRVIGNLETERGERRASKPEEPAQHWQVHPAPAGLVQSIFPSFFIRRKQADFPVFWGIYPFFGRFPPEFPPGQFFHKAQRNYFLKVLADCTSLAVDRGRQGRASERAKQLVGRDVRGREERESELAKPVRGREGRTSEPGKPTRGRQGRASEPNHRARDILAPYLIVTSNPVQMRSHWPTSAQQVPRAN